MISNDNLLHMGFCEQRLLMNERRESKAKPASLRINPCSLSRMLSSHQRRSAPPLSSTFPVPSLLFRTRLSLFDSSSTENTPPIRSFNLVQEHHRTQVLDPSSTFSLPSPSLPALQSAFLLRAALRSPPLTTPTSRNMSDSDPPSSPPLDPTQYARSQVGGKSSYHPAIPVTLPSYAQPLGDAPNYVEDSGSASSDEDDDDRIKSSTGSYSADVAHQDAVESEEDDSEEEARRANIRASKAKGKGRGGRGRVASDAEINPELYGLRRSVSQVHLGLGVVVRGQGRSSEDARPAPTCIRSIISRHVACVPFYLWSSCLWVWQTT